MDQYSLCTLCGFKQSRLYWTKSDKKRGLLNYYQCPQCFLIFLHPDFQWNLEEQKTTYDQHENSIENTGYVKFLNLLAIPLVSYLEKQSEGLDFGSGPGPTLSRIFKTQGFSCQNYDPIYARDHSLLSKTYDFVTATEVFEHFMNPSIEIPQILERIKPQGLLGIMTQLYDAKEFSTWWYHRDPTHVSFYSEKTMIWIAVRFDLQVVYSKEGVWIFQSNHEKSTKL